MTSVDATISVCDEERALPQTTRVPRDFPAGESLPYRWRIGIGDGGRPEGNLRKWVRAVTDRLPLSSTFVKFLIVGGVAFLINELMLFLSYGSPLFWFLPVKEATLNLGLFGDLHTRLFISSVAAVETSIVFQFNVHERWTFGRRERKGWAAMRLLKFNATAAVAAIIAVATVYLLTPAFRDRPYVPNAIGTLLGLAWNWSWNTVVIWPQRQSGVRACYPDALVKRLPEPPSASMIGSAGS